MGIISEFLFLNIFLLSLDT